MRAIVYRVQKKDGSGPYRPRGNANTARYVYAKDGKHSRPTPACDFSRFSYDSPECGAYKGKYRFAFPSLSALYAWFPREQIALLSTEGYKVHRFRAEGVIVSDSGWQCMFRRKARVSRR